MKILNAIAKNTAILSFIVVILNFDNQHSVLAHHLYYGLLTANAQTSEHIVAIRDLQPGKIQTVSGIVEALCDDEFILRDDTSPIVVKVDLEARNIKLFQGEKVTINGIYHQEELEAFQLKKANGELINLNSVN